MKHLSENVLENGMLQVKMREPNVNGEEAKTRRNNLLPEIYW